MVWGRKGPWLLWRGSQGRRSRERARGGHREGYPQGEHFPKAICWEKERADFYEFLQPAELQAQSLKGQWAFGWPRAIRALPCSRREGRQTPGAGRKPAWEQPPEDCHSRGRREASPSLEGTQRGSSWRGPLGLQEPAGTSLSPPSAEAQMHQRRQPWASTGCLTCFQETPLPPALW